MRPRGYILGNLGSGPGTALGDLGGATRGRLWGLGKSAQRLRPKLRVPSLNMGRIVFFLPIHFSSLEMKGTDLT